MDYNNFRTEFGTAQEAEQHAASFGVVLTAKDRERIADLQRAERARLAAIRAGGDGFADRFNANYARFLDVLMHGGNLLLALTRTLAISAGIPLVLLFLLIVEQQRIVDGVMLFEERAHLAHFAAWAFVLVNLVLEFLIHYEERRANYHSPAAFAFSLRLAWHRLLYFAGVGDDWRAKEQSPAYGYRRFLTGITAIILWLALSGSMKDELAAHGDDWTAALGGIIHHSTLLEVATWGSGLLYAFGAVIAAQLFARYVARRTDEIIAELKGTDGDETLDDVATAFIMAKVAKQRERDARRCNPEVAAVPFRGNGRH